MTGIGEWLRQIVMIVLIAAFADLLLPTRTMQKYVRMVMGLAVIAAMLQPLLPAFQRDWADHAAQTIERELATGQSRTPVQPSTAAIGAQWQQQETQTADSILAAQLATAVEQHFSCRVEHTVVSGLAGGESSLRVQMTVTGQSQQTAHRIAAWVATAVGAAPAHVAVSST